MNRFAELLDRLAYEPGRNNKIKLIAAYLRETEDPDRGYGLAAMTGALSFRNAKAGMIRQLIAERTDPALFALSYDYVGDLSETVALMWTSTPPRTLSAPSPLEGEGWGGGSASGDHEMGAPPAGGGGGGHPPPPPGGGGLGGGPQLRATKKDPPPGSLRDPTSPSRGEVKEDRRGSRNKPICSTFPNPNGCCATTPRPPSPKWSKPCRT